MRRRGSAAPRRALRYLAVVLCLTGMLLAAGSASAQWGDSGGEFFGSGGGQEEPRITVSAEFTRPTATEPARLFIAARIEPGWQIYSITQAPGGPVRTEIELQQSSAFRLLEGFQSSPPPQEKVEPLFDNLVVESHYDQVIWHAAIELAAGVDPATLKIEGSVKAQPCEADKCLAAREFPFTAVLGPGMAVEPAAAEQPPPSPPTEQIPAGPPPAYAGAAADGGDARLPWKPYTTFESFRGLLNPSFDPQKLKANISRGFGQSNLLWILGLGFLGGIVLNLMPCVLPVIGLKIMSFVEQAGHDRRRALMLNVWYSAGLLSIFLLLATLAVFLNLGWGHLFKYAGFNIVLAGVVFAMGLSFLGVWEIPIPGFVTSGKAVRMAESEGLPAAFTKGVITTILATPCTGPYMGTALAWAVNQPPLHTYLVFTSVGLGMASPYLLIGAFPELIRFLPKPGAWMETFKQVMGFVLLGTIVYIFTFLEWSYVVPTIGLMFVVWAACWWIGRTPLTANPSARVKAYLEGVTLIGFAWILLFPGVDEIFRGRFAFPGLHDVMAARFDETLERHGLAQIQRLGQGSVYTGTGHNPHAPAGSNTVLVDFTADWCLTCKTFESQVLNTAGVKRLVEQNGVVALKADWTHEAPEVTRLLDLLGARQVPVIAVFPADDPNHPTGVFRGAYTQQQILTALKRAGPSQGTLLTQRPPRP